MIFSFGPTMLVERGWSMAAAGSTISIVLWLTAISVPTGGFLADLTKRGEAIVVAGCIGFALLTVLLSRSGRGASCRHCRRGRLRPARRGHHEPSRASARAEDAGDRDGNILYGLLCRKSGWIDDRRQAFHVARLRQHRARLRRRPTSGLPSHSVVVPPYRGWPEPGRPSIDVNRASKT